MLSTGQLTACASRGTIDEDTKAKKSSARKQYDCLHILHKQERSRTTEMTWRKTGNTQVNLQVLIHGLRY